MFNRLYHLLPFWFSPPVNTLIQPIQTKEAENKLPATLPGKRASLPSAVTSTRSARHGKKKGGAAESDSSDTDLEAPVAKQLLSFIMDDPDFESEGSDTQKINKVPYLSPVLQPGKGQTLRRTG